MNLKKNFIFAGRGIRVAFQEPVFRVHCIIAVLALLAGALLSLTAMEFVLVLFMIGWVLALEIVNTIIEHIIDLLKPEFHEHAKTLKDLASGAVLISSIIAAIAGIVMFAPKLYRLFFVLADWLSS